MPIIGPVNDSDVQRRIGPVCATLGSLGAPAVSTSSTPLAVVTCAVLEDEVRHYAAHQPLVRRIEVLPQGLHNDPPELRRGLQAVVDQLDVDGGIGAIALGYGLCSRGTEGVTSKKHLLVLPRAHDCITVLLGCKKRYADYVAQHPGTYWYSPGWNKHHVPPGPERHRMLRDRYVEQYGEDNADFLMDAEQNWFRSYDRAAYVHLGDAVPEQDLRYTQECAQWLGWNYDYQKGDPALLVDMLAGRWDDERFLVIPPGKTLRMTADERVVEVVDATEC